MEKWIYTGDMNIVDGGGMWIDMSTFSEGWVGCVAVSPLEVGIGWKGAIWVEQGSICLSEKYRKTALDCCGYTESDIKDNPLLLVEAYYSYMGIDRDVINGLLTIQTLKDGDMVFDGMEADERVLAENLKEYIENRYNIVVKEGVPC